MTQAFQSSFVLAYFLGLAFFVFLIVAFRGRRPDIKQRTGPYQRIRHPIYSAVVALWLGAALGTLNWLLLLLWPGVVFGVLKQAQAEEKLLRSHFGARYDTYAASTGGLLPKLIGPAPGAT